MTRAQRRLRTIMRRHGLRRSDVARLAMVSTHSVDAWLKSAESRSYRPIAQRHLRLIELQIIGDEPEKEAS